MIPPVKILHRVANRNPKYIKTELVTYKQGNVARAWEKTITHDTVHILIYNTDSKTLLLVEQARIPYLVNNPRTNGHTLEVCAGIIDKYPELKDVPTKRARLIAVDEIQEELGYKVNTKDLVNLGPYVSSTGGSGANSYPFYCEVTDAQYSVQDLEEGEFIDVQRVPLNDIRAFLKSTNNTDATTRYLMYWFLAEGPGFTESTEEHF